MFRQYLCWILGHKVEEREWPYSGPYVKILVPYCKYCSKCLTILPWQMLVTKHFHEEYKNLPTAYTDLHK